jgi:hypothetical protein
MCVGLWKRWLIAVSALALGLGGGGLWLASMATPSGAVTVFNVTDVGDSGPNTLRQAITDANGRYRLEHIPATALLRDYRQENLDAAERLVQELKLSGVTTALGNAFDRESLASISPRPTIAIASGIYELFPEKFFLMGKTSRH